MSEDRVLESIGKLAGLVEASRDDIKSITTKIDKQCDAVDKITTAVAVIQNNCNTTTTACSSHFKEFNDKLGRDYVRINDLEKKQSVENGIEAYKGKKRDWWQWALGIIGAIIGILIGFNQLLGLKDKMVNTSLSPTSVYAAPLNPDSTKVK